MSLNRCILVGRLTKDPMLRKTQSGTSVTSFTVACGRKVGKDQEPQTDFINCVAWSGTADLVAKYVHKGNLVGVEGRIQTRNYDDEQGKKVYVTEVVCESVQFLESKNKSESTQQQSFDAPGDPFANSPSIDISSDDLPF